MTQERKLLTLQEVAGELGVHLNTVYKLIHGNGPNRLPTIHLTSKAIRVDPMDLKMWMEASKK